MAFPIDFVAALTSEPSVDFVSALSAEQGCDVCHELHASVYELRCVGCEAAICPDCSRLRPDASMACLVCFHRDPGAVYTDGGRRQTMALVQHRSSGLREAVLELARRVRAGEGLGANLRLALLTLTNKLRARFAVRERISYTRVLTSGLPARDVITRSARRAYAASSQALASSARQVSALSSRARVGATSFSMYARSGAATLSSKTLASAARLSAKARSGATVLSTRAHEGGAIVLAHSRSHARASSRRATALALALGMRGRQWGTLGVRHGGSALRVGASFLRLHGATLAARARHGAVAFSAGARRGLERSGRVSRRSLTRTRDVTLRGVVALRNLPVRHHTTAMMVATLLLYAVARADHRDA
jgi:hypothetical protein